MRSIADTGKTLRPKTTVADEDDSQLVYADAVFFRSANVLLLPDNRMNRIKPYLVVIFLIWPILTVGARLMNGSIADDYRRKIENSNLVSGVVEKATHSKTKKMDRYWVDVAVAHQGGVVHCNGPISEYQFKAIEEKRITSVDFYLGPNGCWPAESWENKATDNSLEHWFQGAVLALIPSFLLYLILARIPFGSSRKSLNQRWK